MSDPRAIAQVTTAASALSGAGVTMDVSNASLFVVGQKVELYPSQYGDGAPLARAGQTVRYLIDAIAGQTLVGTINTDGYANPPQVEKGWLVDGRTSAGAGSGYATPSAGGIQDAMDDGSAAGGATVRVQGGLGVIRGALTARSNIKLIIEPGTSLAWESALSTNPVLSSLATRTVIDAFTGTVVEDSNQATLASGGASLARGDLVGICQYKFATVTTPIASPGLVNWTGHALPVGTPVSFSVTGGALPTGIVANTPYFVIAAGMTANVFALSATRGGAAINFTGTSTGTQTAFAGVVVFDHRNAVIGPMAWQMMTLQNVAGNVLQFHEGFAYPFTTAWRLEKFTNVLENFSFEGEITNPDGNDTAPAVQLIGCRDVRINRTEVEHAVVVMCGHNITLGENLPRSDWGLPNGTNYALDVQQSSLVHLLDNHTELIQTDFSARLYHCVDVVTRGNYFGAGARLLTFDGCRKLKSYGDSGVWGSTGMTFPDTDALVGFEPGRGLVSGAEFHHAGENCVFFATWLDMTFENSDYREASAQSITIYAGCTVKLHNVKRDVVGVGTGATVLYIDDAWSAWTPVLSQGGAPLGVTANRCFYRLQGNEYEFEGELVVTNSGTAVALNNILVSWPTTLPALTGVTLLGEGTIHKGGLIYRCVIASSTTAAFGFFITSETVANFAGAGGAIAGALVNGDILRFHGRARISL